MYPGFAEGTFCRIAPVLTSEDDQAGFVRDAVEKKLVNREFIAGEARKAVKYLADDSFGSSLSRSAEAVVC